MDFSDQSTPAIAGAASATQPAPAQGVGGVVAEASRRLHAVSERLKQFLQQKLSQFETAARQCEQVLAQRNSLAALRDEITREKTEWNQQREQQAAEFRNEQDRLIEAWNKMEETQRRMLAHQDLPPVNTSSVAAPVSADPVALPVSDAAFEGGSVFVESARQPAAMALSREEAVEQFRRLKQDCRNHAQRVQRESHVNG